MKGETPRHSGGNFTIGRRDELVYEGLLDERRGGQGRVSSRGVLESKVLILVGP